MIDQRDIKLARRLARLVVEAGEDGVAQVKPALERILVGRSTADRKGFLKAFHKSVVREIRKDTLTIESASTLSDEMVDSLVSHFSEGRERSLHITRKTNPDLIAGMRVRLGDTVYDASLAGNLQTLASRFR